MTEVTLQDEGHGQGLLNEWHNLELYLQIINVLSIIYCSLWHIGDNLVSVFHSTCIFGKLFPITVFFWNCWRLKALQCWLLLWSGCGKIPCLRVKVVSILKKCQYLLTSEHAQWFQLPGLHWQKLSSCFIVVKLLQRLSDADIGCQSLWSNTTMCVSLIQGQTKTSSVSFKGKMRPQTTYLHNIFWQS